MIIKKPKLIVTATLALAISQGLLTHTATANTLSMPDSPQLVEKRPPWSPGSATHSNSGSRMPTSQVKLSRKAIRRLAKSAQNGDAESQYRLAGLYQSGQGLRQDRSKATRWLAQAANQGHAKAQYALAVLYRSINSTAYIKASLDWQHRSAKGGHAEAQYGLGLLYFNGQYLKKNTTLARYWLQKAASSGHQLAVAALRSMAFPVSSGGSSARVSQPQNWQAAGAGGSKAYPQQPVVVAAAPTASVTTQSRPKRVYRDPVKPAPTPRARPVSPPGRPKINISLHGQSVDQLRKAAIQGDQQSQLTLGALYEEGAQGVEQDYEQALRWYLKSARQGYTKAQHNLGLLYEDGRGIPKDYKQAAIWYTKAATSGFSESQNNLAVLYILGRGVARDFDKAELLLRSAIRSGNQDAKRNLRLLQEQGGS